MRESTFRRLFVVGVVLKLIDGVLEVLGGVLVLFVAPATLNRVVRALTQHELSEDPHDFVVNHLLVFLHHLEHDYRLFASLYLLIHGGVKVVLVVALLRRQLWAYPTMLVVLGLFVAYQIYRATAGQTALMLGLSAFDLVVMFLVWHEYRALRAHVAA